MRAPGEYKHIRHWHYSSGSLEYYVVSLCKKAAEENAPINSIYHNGTKWVTLDECNWSQEKKTAFSEEAMKLSNLTGRE